jgi:lipopolysaccharide transport system ATP-binding protein
MSETVIRVERLGKRYRIGRREKYLTLRDALVNAAAAPVRGLKRMWGAAEGSGNGGGEWIWALQDVSLEIERGARIGLIGRNGAGKSTLLKILARITRPTTGRAELRGRVGSLLEVGTGFHNELTGRENIYLSGAILGMRRREIESKFDEILAFAGVEKFVDTPLKHYSTGMMLRLAFAVAAHLEPEILLVDEVLAVGDLEFQKKCLGKMEEVSQGGRTVIFVSHQMGQIRRLCERAIWLDGGRVAQQGPTAAVLGAYESSVTGRAEARSGAAERKGKAQFVRWEILEGNGEAEHTLGTFGRVTVRFLLEVRRALRHVHHGIALYSSERQLLWGTATDHLEFAPGVHGLTYEFPHLPLRPGSYTWRVSLFDEAGLVDDWECLPEMVVATPPVTHPRDEWAGLLNIPTHFSVEPAAVEHR